MLPSKALFSAILLSLPTLATSSLRAEQPRSDAPLRFLSNGVLDQLSLNGKNVLNNHPDHNGLFILYFDGIRLREIRMENITSKGGVIKAVGPKGFPRLEFHLDEHGKEGFKLRLTRIEGMPDTREAALMLRASTQTKIAVIADGGAKAHSAGESVAVYWRTQPSVQGEFGSAVFGH